MDFQDISKVGSPFKDINNSVGIFQEKRKGLLKLKKEYHVVRLSEHDLNAKKINRAMKNNAIVSISLSADGIATIKVHENINQKIHNSTITIVDTRGNKLQEVSGEDVSAMTEAEVDQLAQFFFQIFIKQMESHGSGSSTKISSDTDTATRTAKSNFRKSQVDEVKPAKRKDSDAAKTRQKQQARERTSSLSAKEQAERNREHREKLKEAQKVRERSDEDRRELEKQSERLEQRDKNAS